MQTEHATSSDVSPPVDQRPLLSVRNLRTHFQLPEGTVSAVDGVSFDVHEGRTLALVGESGCGKSVAARSILRIVDRPGRIVEGQILLRREAENGGPVSIDLATLDPDGRQMRHIRGKDITMIFQEPMASFSPVHTIGNQIVEAIRIHQPVSRADARQKAIELLGRTGVPDPQARLDDYPHQLSGGLLQRAMIAMALSSEPRILIADEPTTALDVTTQAQILALLGQLQQDSGMAVIFITHNLGIVAEMADTVVVMYLGNVVEQAPVMKLFESPKHPYTRALLRSIPLLRAPRTRKLDAIAGSVPHPLQRPAGCPFHQRCGDFIAGKCDRHAPQLRPMEPDHHVSCFLHHDVDVT